MTGALSGRGKWVRACLWEEAFVAALRDGGVVARAAAASGVSARAVSKRRKAHPAFALAVEMALDGFRAGIAAAQASAALARTVRIEVGRIGDGAGELRARRCSAGRIGAAAQQRFLVTLAETANVTMAADAAGFSTTAFYARRGADSDFHAAWDGAVADGRVALELMLLAAARRSLEGKADIAGAGPGGIEGPGAGAPTVSVSDAIDILRLSAGLARATAEGRGPKWRAPPRSLDQVRDSILGKLSRMAEAQRCEQQAAGWDWSEEHGIAVPPGWVQAKPAP